MADLNNMLAQDFFALVAEGKLGEADIKKFLKNRTDNFSDRDQINALYNDLGCEIFAIKQEYEQKLASERKSVSKEKIRNEYDLTRTNLNYLERLLKFDSSQNDETDAAQENNDHILSTIHEYLEVVKANLPDPDYTTLTTALRQYFETGKFPTIKNVIRVNKVNVKKFGWALNEIYRKCKDDNSNLPIEYLQFAKENISIFKDVPFDKQNYLTSNLYKYFTTKTQ